MMRFSNHHFPLIKEIVILDSSKLYTVVFRCVGLYNDLPWQLMASCSSTNLGQ